MTPALGWPEPRPQQLITGDRAVQLLDTVSSAALQKAGVKLVTISSAAYQKMVDELVPEVMDGIDPDTGKLTNDVIPLYLSPESLADIDIRGLDGRIEEQFLPTRLSSTALNAALNAANSTKIETDPDGVPVVIGGTATTSDQTVNNLTVTTLTAGDAHADNLTATIADLVNLETDSATLVGYTATQPGAPAANKYKVYVDNTGRVVWKDSASIIRRASNKRLVTSWPVAGESQVGDEAYHSTTGEHRIYKGTTLGWRQASPFEAATLSDRNAITNLYPGYRVFVNTGTPQEHYWDGTSWRGTKSFTVVGSTTTAFSGVNDTGVRMIKTLSITDPGYPYLVRVSAAGEIVINGNLVGRTFVNTNIADNTGGTNNVFFFQFFEDHGQNNQRFIRWTINTDHTITQTGSKVIRYTWGETFANANASTGTYQQSNHAEIRPA